MKLDIKPNISKVLIKQKEDHFVGLQKEEHFLGMDFNFHYDLISASNPVEQILSSLDNWDDALATAWQTVELVTKGVNQ